MKRLSINPRFVNEAGNDLIPGKIHTIRQNYAFWKRFEGEDIALFTWEAKPYRSKQKVFCVKRLVSVQEIIRWSNDLYTLTANVINEDDIIGCEALLKNDGFSDMEEFANWFASYPEDEMAILHFTSFKY
jgi:hypothetical protein